MNDSHIAAGARTKGTSRRCARTREGRRLLRCWGPAVPLGPGEVSTTASERPGTVGARRTDSRHLRHLAAGVLALVTVNLASAQTPTEGSGSTFATAAGNVQRELAQSLEDLAGLRRDIAAEKVPLGQELSRLESQLSELRAELQRKSRSIELQAVELTNLRTSIKGHEDEALYLANLLTDYVRNFDARLQVAELKRYAAPITAARLAVDNPTLSREQVFRAQLGAVEASIGRIDDALGGTVFAGSAVDGSGLVREGTFAMLGPAALFRSADGQQVGTVEQIPNSLEPTIVPFEQPEVASAAASLVQTGGGSFPLDATLGNAHKIESTHETFLQHVKKGGPVMIPIFVLAGLGILVAVYKWLSLALVGRPSRRQLAALLDSVGRRDREGARRHAQAMKGPVGRMLRVGVDNLAESKDLMEEAMYEQMLTTRLGTNRLLPFISICAASAPLLGLLGTVTGIIETFKQITLFGSGDVKNLSSGISEALITTEFGLIVAIPALLVHSFLSRKARGVVGQMEQAAVAFVNEAVKAAPKQVVIPHAEAGPGAPPDAALVREQVHAILSEMLGPLSQASDSDRVAQPAAS